MTALPVEYDLIEDTMMSASYAEARSWIDWIRVFTVADLADTMVVDYEVAKRFITAALYHGIIKDCGPAYDDEHIYEYVPLPPGPTHHYTGPLPERTAPGVYELAPRNRGMPIRLPKDDRRAASTPGSRGKILRREQAYERQVAAVAARRKKQQERRANGEPDPYKRKVRSKKVDW